LKPRLVFIIFENSVRTSERTPHFTITKFNWLMLFKEIIALHSENYAKPINTKCRVTDFKSSWDIYLPLAVKGVKMLTLLQRQESDGRIQCVLLGALAT
jgi:hypothetical protein